MSKPLSLSIAACIALSGCQIFHKSPTWKTVVRTRVAVPRGEDASRVYADGLHHRLQAGRVEHKVVTYEYRYRSRLRDDATAERTAVIYRDDANPKYPWWIKDESRGRPTWLPNGNVKEQLEFYVGRDVQVTSPGSLSGEGKQLAVGEREPVLRRIARVLRLTPQPVAEASRGPGSEDVFRSVHGTQFDPVSRVDREKMDALLRSRNSVASVRPL